MNFSTFSNILTVMTAFFSWQSIKAVAGAHFSCISRKWSQCVHNFPVGGTTICPPPLIYSPEAKLYYWNYFIESNLVWIRVLQVNLFQKLSFLNQLTHNMMRDCSLNSPQNTSSQHVVYKYCFEQNVKTKTTLFAHNILWTCTFQGIQWIISHHIVG